MIKKMMLGMILVSTALIADPLYNIGDFVSVAVTDPGFAEACKFPEEVKITGLRYNTENTVYEIEAVQCVFGDTTEMVNFTVFEENLTLVRKGNFPQ